MNVIVEKYAARLHVRTQSEVTTVAASLGLPWVLVAKRVKVGKQILHVQSTKGESRGCRLAIGHTGVSQKRHVGSNYELV